MYKYSVLIRTSSGTNINTFVWADNDFAARVIAEAQFGVGNVIYYTQVSE